MPPRPKKEDTGLFKSVLFAHFILLLHLLLIAGLGALVLFFRGIVQYMLWIFLIGSAALIISGYVFYRRMKEEGKKLREMLHSPIFSGRSLEINFLGGLLSFRIGRPSEILPLDANGSRRNRQLESPSDYSIRELTELTRLLDNNLITREEYNRAKQQIFK